MASSSTITQLLLAHADGEIDAGERLFPLI
jgi:hypothetical protein